MPNIQDLPNDIYELLEVGAVPSSFTADIVDRYGNQVSDHFVKAIYPEKREPSIRASNYGRPCTRQMWYEMNGHTPQQMDGSVYMKFAYGNVVEEMVMHLAQAAGHNVSEEQKEIIGPFGVKGHIDGVVDNYLIDVKSASGYGFDKFNDMEAFAENDSFGYLWQLGLYYHFIDITVEGCGFLVLDKQTGHLKFVDATAHIPTKPEVIARMSRVIDDIGLSTEPTRPVEATPKVAKNGNCTLATICRYCPYKMQCWQHDANDGDGLRVFMYSTGPTYFTDVKSTPRVPEIE